MFKITVLFLCATTITASGATSNSKVGVQDISPGSPNPSNVASQSPSASVVPKIVSRLVQPTIGSIDSTKNTTEDKPSPSPVTNPSTTVTAENMNIISSAEPNTNTNAPTTTTVTSSSEATTLPPATKTTMPATITTAKTTNTSTTTTTPPPTTPGPSPAPTTPAPIPEPSTGKWVVNGTNITCIVVEMAVQINVTYETAVNKSKSYKLIDVPTGNATNATGLCGSQEQNLTLSWKSLGSANNTLMLHFIKNETTKEYTLHHLEVSIAPQELPKYDKNVSLLLVHNASEFTTGLTNSYRCLRLQKLDLKQNNSTEVVGHLAVSHLMFQAFRADNTTVFGLAKDCAFDTPDIVPIAVGVALAVLVVIVLIAYLVGRRRSQVRGYSSM